MSNPALVQQRWPVRPRLFVTADVSGSGHYHLGDEAMLEANLRMLRRFVPNVQFTVSSRDPHDTSGRYGVDALPSPHLRRRSDDTRASLAAMMSGASGSSEAWAAWLGQDIAGAVREAGGLVISGGGNLCDMWPEHICERVALIEVARAAGRPTVVLGQMLGPTLSVDQRRWLAASLSSCAWVGVRDEASGAMAASLGVPANRLHRQLDDAFFLEPSVVDDRRTGSLPGRDGPWILLTLDASFGGPERSRTLDSIARQLDALTVSLDARLLFAPHVSGPDVPPPGQADDTAAAALRQRLRSPLVVLDAWQSREMRWLVGRAALVVSTRYHPLVFATAAGVPSVGIYSDAYTRAKLRGALAPAGLDGWCISVADAEQQALLPLALELWRRRRDVGRRLARLRGDAWPQEHRRWDGICRALRLAPDVNASVPQWHGYSAASNVPTTHGEARVTKDAFAAPAALTDDQWRQYQQDGYLRLGTVLSGSALASVRQRLDDMMLGRVRNPAFQFQLDTGGRYEDLPDAVANPAGETLQYRKVQGLESDPLMLEVIRRPLFRDICARQYGRHSSISIFRAMMMNKPAQQGTYLPWHQDGGDVWKLDRDPLVTIWIALDPATRENGCLEVIPRSHALGLLSRNGSTISEAHARIHCQTEAMAFLTVEAGEALLLHNWLLHRSGINRTDAPRRALTTCYMDARTMNTLTGRRFPMMFGEHEDEDEALPFLRVLKEERRQLQASAAEAERYAKSLLDDSRRREEMRAEAEAYAKSLETELAHQRAR